MNKYLFILIFIFIYLRISAQNDFALNLIPSSKKIIDTEAIRKWPSLGNVSISNDANYIQYFIWNQPVASYTLQFEATEKVWKKTFVVKHQSKVHFTTNSQKAIFKNEDTLFILHLGTDTFSCILNVDSYKLPQNDQFEWITYKLKNESNVIALRNIFSNEEKRFPNVIDYIISDNAKKLFLITSCVQNGVTIKSLVYVDILTQQVKTVSRHEQDEELSINIGNIQLDDLRDQLAYIVEAKALGKVTRSIWYYKDEFKNAVMRVYDKSFGIDSNMYINPNVLQFSTTGKYILFSLSIFEERKENKNGIQVDVWGYRDSVLQTAQLKNLQRRSFIAAINTDSGKVTKIEREDEFIVGWPKADYVVISDKTSINEPWWKTYSQKSYFLVSLKDGTRRIIANQALLSYTNSLTGKYLVYYDAKELNYFKYEISTGEKVNITKGIKVPLNKIDHFSRGDLPGTEKLPIGVAGWLSGDSALFLYDEYDIWQIDLMSKKEPVNVTGGYGRSNKIRLRFVYEDNNEAVNISQPILLTAFSQSNKHNGFYRLRLFSHQKLELLYFGPCLMYSKNSQMFPHSLPAQLQPIKARDKNVWVVQMQKANEAPNYFLTKDFKEYKAVTKLQPQKDYKWLTGELISWKMLDGTWSHGILYKPEDFNPNNKYPILFNYYEQMSQALNLFQVPKLTGDNINIPWFVSRGYIVFTPDIYYTIGKTGHSVYNSVVSAAQFLSQYSWVDKKRMGLQGHSFGGYETNYIITHSKLFAAAAEAAGTTNWTSAYGQLDAAGESRQIYYENRQSRLGATLWQRLDLYIENSPIFNADKVTTPLLIMHNVNDPGVPWEQAVEFFTSLRRLGKKAWMLQYDKGEHWLSGLEAQDYTTRLTQFFDHFLKDKPAPMWMTKGICAAMKGIETGYDLDTTGNCGKDCKVCQKWNSMPKAAKSSE